MPPRLAVAACCLLMAWPLAASAAAPACPQLTDPRGDSTAVADDASDLVSVALSTRGRAMTLSVRYAGEQAAATPVSGHVYTVHLDDGENAVSAWAYVAPTGSSFTLFRAARGAGAEGAEASAGTAIGPLEGRVDARTHTVTMRVPQAMANDVLRTGRRLTVNATASTAVLTPEVPVTGRVFATEETDVSDAPGLYRVGAKGC